MLTVQSPTESFQLPGLEEAALREAASHGDDILSLLRELGFAHIKDDERTQEVPLEDAFFDTRGCGPYDKKEL